MNDKIESLKKKNVISVVARGDDEYIKSGILEGHYQNNCVHITRNPFGRQGFEGLRLKMSLKHIFNKYDIITYKQSITM